MERKLEAGSNGQLFPSGKSDNWVSTFHDNNGLCLTIIGLRRVTVVSVKSYGIWQSLICVPAVRNKLCPTLLTLVL